MRSWCHFVSSNILSNKAVLWLLQDLISIPIAVYQQNIRFCRSYWCIFDNSKLLAQHSAVIHRSLPISSLPSPECPCMCLPGYNTQWLVEYYLYILASHPIHTHMEITGSNSTQNTTICGSSDPRSIPLVEYRIAKACL